MKNEELRSIFQREIMPQLFLFHPGLFYEAFNEGPEAVDRLLLDLWADICNQGGDHVNNHPLQIETNYIILDETEDNYTCLMIIKMPNLKKVRNLAVYFGVFLGVNTELRLFLGETDYHALGSNRYIVIIELQAQDDGYRRINHSLLFQGCNNEPLLFEKPANPRTPDQFAGIDPEDEWHTFTDVVAQICLLPPKATEV
jgi:hypothetical protein